MNVARLRDLAARADEDRTVMIQIREGEYYDVTDVENLGDHGFLLISTVGRGSEVNAPSSPKNRYDWLKSMNESTLGDDARQFIRDYEANESTSAGEAR